MKPGALPYPEPMRLQCLHCDREDADGVYEIPAGWTDVREDQWSREHFEGAWWTHSGVCPDCALENG